MANIRYQNHHTNKPQFSWPMSKKHESIKDENLIYCFVHITDADKLPKFFLVPSKEVANQLKEGHSKWLKKGNVKDNPMRNFRIEIDDPNGYENNWYIFQ